MGQKSRVRRPPLDRTAPIRSWASVLGNAVVPPHGETHGPDMHAANGVVEEFLRAGLDGAATFSRGAGSEQPRNSAERILQTTSNLASSCVEFLIRMAPMAAPFAAPFTAPSTVPNGGARPVAESGARPSATAAPSATLFGPPVTIETRGGVPLSISLALQPGVPGGSPGGIKIQRLSPRSIDAPPLTGVSVTRQPSGHIVVRVDVDAAAPPDSYDGVLLDASSSLPVGTLSVTIENSAASKARRRTKTVRRDRHRTRR